MLHLPGYLLSGMVDASNMCFGGGHVWLQIAKYPKQPYKLFKSGLEHSTYIQSLEVHQN